MRQLGNVEWLGKDDGFLRRSWTELSDQEIGDRLGRTACSVKARRQKLKIKRPRKHNFGKQILENMLDRMQYLIRICTYSDCRPLVDDAKEELKMLSGIVPRKYKYPNKNKKKT